MLPRGISRVRSDTATCEPNCLDTRSRKTAESDPETWLVETWLNDFPDPSVCQKGDPRSTVGQAHVPSHAFHGPGPSSVLLPVLDQHTSSAS
jgi:hypothetical protein